LPGLSGAGRRRKGITAELDACTFLRGFAKDGVRVQATRTYHQARGGTEAADIDHSIFGYHIEVTVDRKMKIGSQYLTEKLDRARADAEDLVECTAVVLWHPPQYSWRMTYRDFNGCVVTASATDWMLSHGYTSLKETEHAI